MKTEKAQLQDIAVKVIKDLKQLFIRKGFNDTGNLLSSIKYRLGKDAIFIDMNAYAETLDSGTRPHTPPIGPLIKWSRVNGNINPWAVSAKISKFGTRAKPWIKQWKEELKNIEDDLVDYLEIIVITEFESNLNKDFKIE